MRRFIMVIIILSLVILLADWLILRMFLNIGFERRCFFIRTNGSETNPHIQKIGNELRWLDAREKRDIEVQSFDGLKLRGYYAKADRPERIVLMLHGWRGSWRHDFGACARWFLDHGCSLLLIDERAQGRSEGRYMTFGLLERRDCHTWLQWIKGENRMSQLPVYLYGVSMGASTALMAAGEALPEQVKGIIADCGFVSPYDAVYRFGRENFKVKEWPLMGQLVRKVKRRVRIDLKSYTTLDAMKSCRVPVLFIHGTGDIFVPCSESERSFEACTSEKRLLLTEGAAHCMSFSEDPEGYTDAVTEFFGWK